MGSSGAAGQGGMLRVTTILGCLGTPAVNMGFTEMLLEQLGAVMMLLLRGTGAKNHHNRPWISASVPESANGGLAGQLESLPSWTGHPRLGREQGQLHKNLKYRLEREEEACRSLTATAANSFGVNVICKYSTNYL